MPERDCNTCVDKPHLRKWEKLDTSGESYSSRTGHCVVCYKDVIYLFGGTDSERRQNDLHTLCLKSLKWTKIRGGKLDYKFLPSRRSGAKGLMHKDKFIIFGGYDGRGGNYFNDVHEFDFGTSLWNEVPVKSRKDGSKVLPSPRTDHSVCYFRGTIVVFGGYDGRVRLNDVFGFKLSTSRWHQIIPRAGPKPCRRFAHSSVIYKGSMYVFGGWNGSVTLNSMWKFTFATRRWTCLYYGNEKYHKDLESPKPSRKVVWPSHRYRHTAVTYKAKMIIFGGVDRHHRRFNDIFVYDFRTGKWHSPTIFGIKPAPRTFHPAITIRDHMYVFGGYNGESRLSDVHKIYLGKTNPMPLQVLAGDVVRANYKALNAFPINFSNNISDGVIWKRDSEGYYRGGITEDGVIICHLYEPEFISNNLLSSRCSVCGRKAQDHLHISKQPIKTKTSMSSTFKHQLNVCNKIRTVKNVLGELNASEVNKKRTIVTRSISRKHSSVKHNGCSSPTLTEPEGKNKVLRKSGASNVKAGTTKKRRVER